MARKAPKATVTARAASPSASNPVREQIHSPSPPMATIYNPRRSTRLTAPDPSLSSSSTIDEESTRSTTSSQADTPGSPDGSSHIRATTAKQRGRPRRGTAVHIHAASDDGANGIIDPDFMAATPQGNAPQRLTATDDHLRALATNFNPTANDNAAAGDHGAAYPTIAADKVPPAERIHLVVPVFMKDRLYQHASKFFENPRVTIATIIGVHGLLVMFWVALWIILCVLYMLGLKRPAIMVSNLLGDTVSDLGKAFFCGPDPPTRATPAPTATRAAKRGWLS